MSLREVKWLQLVCDDCGHDHPAKTPAFDSIELPTYIALGWRVDEQSGHVTCKPCLNRIECAARGHDWYPWSQWLPMNEEPSLRVRACRGCNAGETERAGVPGVIRSVGS